MNPGLTLHLRLRAPPALVHWGLVALCLLAAPVRIVSESVSMQTYYPAPSGVYQKLLTTGTTWLARDGASSYVGIGTTAAPAAGVKLAVMGGNTGMNTGSPRDSLEVAGSMRVYSPALAGVKFGGGGSLEFDGSNVALNSPAGLSLQPDLGPPGLTVTAAGNVGAAVAAPAVALDVGGDIIARGCTGISHTATTAYPNDPPPPAGGPTLSNCSPKVYGTYCCPSGTYAAWMPGVLANYEYQTVTWASPHDALGTFTGNDLVQGDGAMLCCPCPSAAQCGSMP